MIKITVCNETETDRDEILQFLKRVAGNRDIIFEDIPLLSPVTFLTEQHKMIHLCCKDIYYFEYLKRKVKIVTVEREYICINEKIGDIAKRMKQFGFVMCHQSFVVNLNEIVEIHSQELVMSNGDHVYLAQKRAAAIRKELRSQREKILI